MSTSIPTQLWEPLNIPIAEPAKLAAIVAAAESMAEQAQWQLLNIRAARIEALAQAARAAVVQMAELQEPACLPNWKGTSSMCRLGYRSQRVVSLARQARREFTTYQRHRARLETGNRTIEGKIP
jgi:hypothetical protein